MSPCVYAYDHEWTHVLGGCESHKHVATPRLANRTLFMVTFHEPTLKLHVITLTSPMSDYYMK